MKRTFKFLILSALLLVSETFGQTEWEKDSSNPVLIRGEEGSWNDAAIGSPSVIYEGELYHMWFNGNDGSNTNIGYATSSDKTNWDIHPDPVLETGLEGSWDDLFILHPTVYFDGETYHMWYTGNAGGGGQIGYATSVDLMNWTKYAGNPVLTLGPSGEWDNVSVNSPEVLIIDGLFHMWYSGNNGSITQTGHASSEDGINWVKDELNPVLKVGDSGDWDNTMSFNPSVVFDGTAYHMYYAGGENFKWSIGYASSNDGINWIKDEIRNPVLNPGEPGSWDSEYIGYHTVVYNPDSTGFDMWYTGSAVTGFAGDIGFASAFLDPTTSLVENGAKSITEKYLLSQNYPNPFNPSTVIAYQIPQAVDALSRSAGTAGRIEVQVTLKIYDILGREVSTLVNQKQKPGYYELKFDAHNLPSGIYLYKFHIFSASAGNFVQTKKMILLK